MKWILCMCFIVCTCIPARAQQEEIEQLLLNWQKLEQLKQILSDMKTGYEVISKGYGMIRDISSGNFSLHKLFLDKMLEVSPVVRGYYKVGEIMAYNISLANEYQGAVRLFGNSEWLREAETSYIREVFKVLHNKSLESLNELAMVITSGKMRMSDDERLSRIDGIYERSKLLLINLRALHREASTIIYERSGASDQLERLGLIYGFEK